MRNMVIALAVLAAVATVIAVHFFSDVRGLTFGTLTAGDGLASTQVAAYQVAAQFGASAALSAVILTAAACIVHAISADRAR
jgi:hypothetical protein